MSPSKPKSPGRTSLPACASLELEFNMVATIDQDVACDDHVLFQMHLISLAFLEQARI